MLKTILNMIIFPIDYLLDYEIVNKIQVKILNTLGLVILGLIITIGVFIYHIVY